MQVSEFLIGHGEVYVDKAGGPRRFVEVCSVQASSNNCGRWILIADHVNGKRLKWTKRIVFGAVRFLNSYRPATVADFRPRSLAACPSSRATHRGSVSSSQKTS